MSWEKKSVAFFISVIGIPAVAQQTLPTISVIGENVPSGVDRLTLSEISWLRSGRQDPTSLFTELPGVFTLGGGAISSLPVIRGFAGERIRITIDGADLAATCPNHMNTPFSYLSPEAIGVVDLYPGVIPVSVGGDAIGGGIIAERATVPFAEGEKITKEAEVGFYAHGNGNGKTGEASVRYATSNFAIQYRTSAAQRDNIRAGGGFKTYRFTGRTERQLDLDEIGSTAYQVHNHALDFGWLTGAHEWRAEIGYQKQPYQLYPNQRMDLLDNEAKRFSVSYRGALEWGELDVRLNRQDVDHFMDFGKDKRFWYGSASGGANPTDGNARPCAPIGSTCAAGMPMYTASATYGVKIKATVPFTEVDVLRLGGEWNRLHLDDWWPPSGASMWPDTFWNIRDGRRVRTAAFVEWEKLVSAEWRTIIGTRLERVEASAGKVQGYASANSTGLMMNWQQRDASFFNALERERTDINWNLAWLNEWRVAPSLFVHIDLARQVRSPSLYELYPWSTWQMAALMNNLNGDGNGYIGNPYLKPEVAYTVSARLRWQEKFEKDDGWRVEWRPYYTVVTDYIDAIQWDASSNAPRQVPLRNTFTVLRYVNVDAKLFGYELSATTPWSDSPLGRWRSAIAFAYNRGENRDSGDNLYGIMPRYLKLRLEQEDGMFHHRLTVEVAERKEQVNRMRNEIVTPGYAVVHWRGSQWITQTALLEFGIDNLFDRKYYLPLGGAYLGQGTTMTIPPLPNQPQWGVAVPGMGRNLWAGLKIFF